MGEQEWMALEVELDRLATIRAMDGHFSLDVCFGTSSDEMDDDGEMVLVFNSRLFAARPWMVEDDAVRKRLSGKGFRSVIFSEESEEDDFLESRLTYQLYLSW